MLANSSTDPIETTWPTPRRETLDTAARCLYELVKPPAGLPWEDLSDGQHADYRRRMLDAALATARTGACPTDEQIAAWVDDCLPVREFAHVELHLGACGRCQEIAGGVLSYQFETAVGKGGES